MSDPGERVVVVTRRTRGETATLLEAAGCTVHHLPAIALTPPTDPEGLRRAVAEQSSYDDLVFTSAAAVEVFVAAAIELGVPTFGSARLVAVGPATAGAVVAAGGEVGLVGSAGGEALVDAYSAGALSGRRILMPRAEKGREEFPEAARAAGAEVEVIAAYRTELRSEAGVELEELLAAGGVEAVCFASPSAVEAIAAGLADPEAWRRFTSVAIGETTAAALRGLGVDRIVVASEPSSVGLAEAVLALG